MNSMQGRGIAGKKAGGKALVTRMPVNFTASFTKPLNLVPGQRSLVLDRHHDLYRKKIAGSILVFPSCIGSTYSGMVLMELIAHGDAPAAMIVGRSDSLLVSGIVLADVWFGRGIPLVEYGSDDLFERIRTGDAVEVDGQSGAITIR